MYQEKEFNELYDYLCDVLEKQETVDCLLDINGHTLETLQDCLYYFTGYHSLDQIYDEE